MDRGPVFKVQTLATLCDPCFCLCLQTGRDQREAGSSLPLETTAFLKEFHLHSGKVWESVLLERTNPVCPQLQDKQDGRAKHFTCTCFLTVLAKTSDCSRDKEWFQSVASKLSCTMTPLLPCGLSNNKALLEEEEGEREREERKRKCVSSHDMIWHFLFSHGWPLVEWTEPNHCLNDAEI